PGRDVARRVDRDRVVGGEVGGVRYADAVAADAVLRVLGLGGAAGRTRPGRELTGPGQRRGVRGTLHLVLVERPEAVVDRQPRDAQQAHHHHRDQDQRLTRLTA